MGSEPKGSDPIRVPPCAQYAFFFAGLAFLFVAVSIFPNFEVSIFPNFEVSIVPLFACAAATESARRAAESRIAAESVRTAVAAFVECRVTTNHSTAARTIRPSNSGQTFRPSFRRIGISATELTLALSR